MFGVLFSADIMLETIIIIFLLRQSQLVLTRAVLSFASLFSVNDSIEAIDLELEFFSLS